MDVSMIRTNQHRTVTYFHFLFSTDLKDGVTCADCTDNRIQFPIHQHTRSLYGLTQVAIGMSGGDGCDPDIFLRGVMPPVANCITGTQLLDTHHMRYEPEGNRQG